ncbi:PIN domain-containing protein [Gottfriedia solisilvae]|uniref:PIN domain-containing protein n=1 Tax=Gottfriedia solisilvae TaxID=1516104 RepID=UPI003D2EFC99
MSGFLSATAGSFLINWVTNLAWDNKLKRDDKKSIETIKFKISEHNRRFDNTELDSFAFQKFMERQEVVSEIYDRVFNSYKTNAEPIEDFIKKIAESAIREVNQYYERIQRGHLKSEGLMYEYFNDLIERLIEIRDDLLSLQSAFQTSIIVDEVRETREALKKVIIEEVEKLREDNTFADEKIEKVKHMIDLYKLSEAEDEVKLILDSKHLLSKLQKEDTYYQLARIYINSNNFEKLDGIKSTISSINSESKFLSEINLHIACNLKDRKLFNDVIHQFNVHRYSDEQLTLKTIYFELIFGNFEVVKELLLFEEKIKIELQEHHQSYYYYGHILLRDGDFKGAFNAFTTAWEKYNNIIYKYNSLITKYYEFSTDEKYFYCGNTESLEEIKLNVGQLIELKRILDYFEDEDQMDFWKIVIDLTMSYDQKEALNLLTHIGENIKHNNEIKSIIASVYFTNQMYQEAKEVLIGIWKEKSVNTALLFNIHAMEEDWNSIIEKSSLIHQDEHPMVQVLILKALYKLKGYEIVKDNIIPLAKKFPNAILLLKELLIIVIDANDEFKKNELLEIINKHIVSISDIELNVISQVLFNNKKMLDLRELIANRIEFHEELLYKYFKSFGNFEELSKLTNVAYERIKELYDKGVKFGALLKFKAEIEMISQNWRKAAETLQEYKVIYGLDEYTAYYLVISKIQRQEFDALDEEVAYLLSTQVPVNHLLVASLKAKQEKWHDAKEISFKTLYLSHDKLSSEILNGFINLYFSNLDKEQNQVNLKQVDINSVSILKNESETRIIAIHQNKDLIKNSGEVKFGCENLFHDDPIALILLSEGSLGDKVELIDGNYEVVEILNIFTYFFRYCLDKLQSDYPEHGYFIALSAPTAEESIEAIKDTMKKITDDKNQLLEGYNFKVETGLPISYLSGKSYNNYVDTALSLIYKMDQYYYAGEVSIFKDVEYVLTLSSLTLMAHLGLLDKLEEIKEKCLISTEMIRSVEIGMRESLKKTKLESGTVMLNDEEQLTGYTFSIEDKKATRRFWTSLRLVLSKLENEKVQVEDIDIYDAISKLCLDVDIEAIEMSKKPNRVMVCDDLFIRKINHSITNSSNTTNFIGLLVSEKLISYEELFDIILKLMKFNYLYPINRDILITLSMYINSLKDDKLKKIYFDKLKEIFQLMANSNLYYSEIYKGFLNDAMKVGINAFWLYQLMRAPLELKPIKEFLSNMKY